MDNKLSISSEFEAFTSSSTSLTSPSAMGRVFRTSFYKLDKNAQFDKFMELLPNNTFFKAPK